METDGKTEKGDRRKDGEGRQTERRRRETDGKTDGKTEKGDRRKNGEGRQTERRRKETDGKTEKGDRRKDVHSASDSTNAEYFLGVSIEKIPV